MYPAHIINNNGQYTEQSVYEHCLNTAKYASELLEKVGLSACGELVGIIHDIGKNCNKFSEYLYRAVDGDTSGKGTVNHSFAAVIFILERYHKDTNSETEKLTAEILAWATASHHGTIDLADVDGKSGFLHRLNKDREEICYDEVMNAFKTNFSDIKEIDMLFAKATEETECFFGRVKSDCGQQKFCGEKANRIKTVKYMCGMIARLILSALIDADRRDTAEFMTQSKFSFVKADKSLWDRQLAYYESKIQGLGSDTPINKARRYISDCSHDAAFRDGGIYRISVPTGAGKTLATMRYALAHAREYDKSRIIFVTPLLSVLEQNSCVIKDYILDKEIVTEHHSNVVMCDESDDELDKYELVSQTWETPVLITTLVQLLNALFSGKTTAIRRMKSLCNAVIVLDEVQSLPHKMLYMFNEAVNFLAYYCGTTIVLSSATQPCLEAMDFFLALPENSDIVPFDKEIFAPFKRTEIVDKCSPYGMSVDELADFSIDIISENRSLLIICNTRNSAKQLYKSIRSMCDCKVFHLSNNMCMKHRVETLEMINNSLDAREKIICVSTQLVECGVDFSFESCIRVKAGIDNIAQAAGRCNRSNDFGHICKVYIVSLKDENLSHLKEIREAQNCTTQVLYNYFADSERFSNDLLGNEAVNEYYHQLFGNFIGKDVFSYPVKDFDNLFEMLSCNANYSERYEAKNMFVMTQAFKTAGRLFEVFDSRAEDVIVPYNAEAREIICNLCSERARFDYHFLSENSERAKPYSIRVFMDRNKDYMFKSYENGHFTVLLEGYYNSETGLDEEIIF